MTFRMAPLTVAMLVALAAINGWLVSVVVQDQDPGEIAVDPKRQAPNLPAVSAEPASPRPIGAHSEILTRPVFFKARQPFVAPPPAPPPIAKVQPTTPPVAVDPGLALGGVMIDDNTKRAYVFSKASGQGQWLSEGEIIVGWKLETIDSGSVRLQQGGRTKELHLYPPAR